MGLGYSIRLVKLVILCSVISKGTRSGIHSSHALTILSSLPVVEHVSGLGHLGGVEHQVDVVVLEETARLASGRQ